MKVVVRRLLGQLAFRLFVSHVIVAALTGAGVTLFLLLLTRNTGQNPTIEVYRSVAVDYTRTWLSGVPDGEPTDTNVDPMVGWTLILSPDETVLWSRGETDCRAGMRLTTCMDTTELPPEDTFFEYRGEQWAMVRVSLANGDQVWMRRGPVIAEPILIYGNVEIRGYTAMVAFEVLSRAVLALPVALLLAWVVTRPQVKRLRLITKTSSQFASGDLSARIQDTNDDEVGRLAQQFDAMADGLAQNIELLQSLAQRNADLALQAEQAAIKAERNRISRDLHDAIAQRLFSLSVSTKALPQLIAQNMERGIQQARVIADMAEQTLLDLRALLVELRPSQLVQQGLADSLRRMFQQWQSLQRVQVEAALMLTGRHLPSPIEDAIYQITQEALSNVARHAAASLVEISLVEGKNQLILSISDNGLGFDPQAQLQKPHFGLVSMRERSAMFGGTFSVESVAGRGTTLQVTLPLVEITGEAK
jgi:NarL family two-component system sensor histidine kinase LiaS